MFALQIPGWQIVVRTVVVYLAVYVGLRLMGKRELGQMTVFDLVVILLIANAVQNATVGPDASVAGGARCERVWGCTPWVAPPVVTASCRVGQTEPPTAGRRPTMDRRPRSTRREQCR